ncbi:hypothetical protein [Staphylococcus lutrae]|uniref:DUF5640 domain-containing protein n=1 Tax=Staphylococcus lutrae TaxID=155085 RepID=A0AAC9RRC9_9STAP|nr:hypothetical protein [Staphylococcus lutrae]ARJ50923.1 hypothetical protein B5P37_06110 [Staphylococcus lutrae]PNZ34178.1 hypothetical protein CD134_11225 [Staphylococcus lutrae]
MKKLLLTLTVLFIGIVLSACTDSEIKKLNGKWEGYDGADKIVMDIKNGKVKIVNYGESATKEEAEKLPLEAKIYKENETLKIMNEEGDGQQFQVINDVIVFEGASFTRVD